jgi:N-hydroxyarylamine O-acetyltransferase
MTTSLDLEAYLERIGWGGGTRPSFDTLAGLLRAHMSASPENPMSYGSRCVSTSKGSAKLVRALAAATASNATLFASVSTSSVMNGSPFRARVL